MLDAGPAQRVNKDCNPPWTHSENCRCDEYESQEAEDYRETLLDRYEGPFQL